MMINKVVNALFNQNKFSGIDRVKKSHHNYATRAFHAAQIIASYSVTIDMNLIHLVNGTERWRNIAKSKGNALMYLHSSELPLWSEYSPTVNLQR